jgi:hypothetical protein
LVVGSLLVADNMKKDKRMIAGDHALIWND